MIDVTLYEASGTLVKVLSATEASPDVDGSRNVRRTAGFVVPISELAELRIFGRTIKMTDRATGKSMFTGYYDDVAATAEIAEGTVRVSCRDKAKKLKEAAFAEDTTFSDAAATDTGQLIVSATATSSLAAGYEMQAYADVYEQVVTVYDLGAAKRVNDAKITEDIRYSDLAVQASGANVQKVVLDVRLDLKASESLQQITLTDTGYARLIEVSTDGVAWTSYVSGAVTCRYIHVQVTGGLTFTAGIRIYAGTAYPASNALVDNEASWRPALSDLQREITFDAGASVSANVLLLRWGLNDAERRTLVQYEVLAQVGTEWRSLGKWYANSGLAEAAFADLTARYWKVRVLGTWEGRPALRYGKLARVVATDTVDQVVKAVAQGEGETSFSLTPTRRRVKATFEAGRSKWESLQKAVAEALGDWELFYSADGILTLRPRVLRTDKPRKVSALLPPFTITYSDADVRNEIVAVYEGQNSTFRAVARNENAASSTSIPRIGRRTEVLKTSLADTQDKLTTFAQRELAVRGRVTIPAEATVAAAADYDAWEVWRVIETKTGTDALFILTAFSVSANKEQATYDLRARLEVA